MSDFLGRNLSEEAIQKIAEHCSFKAMKSNNMSNFNMIPKELMDSDKSPFLRKGEVLVISWSVCFELHLKYTMFEGDEGQLSTIKRIEK